MVLRSCTKSLRAACLWHMLLLWVLGVIALTGCASEPAPEFYYYYRGDKIPLQIDRTRVALRLRHGGLDSLEAFLDARPALFEFDSTAVEEFSVERLYLVPVVPGAQALGVKTIVDSLQMDIDDQTSNLFFAGNVVFVEPSMKAMALTNQVILKLKGGTAPLLLNDFVENRVKTDLGLIRDPDFPPRPDRVILRPQTRSPLDALEAANRLVEDYPDFVDYAHPNFIVRSHENSQELCTSDDEHLAQQWHLYNDGVTRYDTPVSEDLRDDARVLKAWCMTKGDPSIAIAIVDDAVDAAHPDLAPNYFDGIPADPILNLVFDTDYDATDPKPRQDSELHGTKVTGLAVAEANEFGVAGSCPECSMIPFRALWGVLARTEAIHNAVDYGASVIVCPWVLEVNEFDELEDAIFEAFTEGRDGLGTVVVFGTHNANVDTQIAALPEVIAVGPSRKDKKRIPGSAYGKKLDLIAPGSEMATTAVRLSVLPGHSELMLKPHDGYELMFYGSSASAPLVAGIAGLVLSIKPELSATDVREILISTADRIDTVAANYHQTTGFSETHGYGRVNAYEAVKAAFCWDHWEAVMVPVSMPSLWMAIALSTIIVMLLDWLLRYTLHSKDFRSDLEPELRTHMEGPEAALQATASITAGHYKHEHRTEDQVSRIVQLRTYRPASIWLRLFLSLLYCASISVLVAYVVTRTLLADADYLAVFRVTGTVAFLAYGLGKLPDAIWLGRSWGNVGKYTLEAVLFGLITAGFFGWRWPN